MGLFIVRRFVSVGICWNVLNQQDTMEEGKNHVLIFVSVPPGPGKWDEQVLCEYFNLCYWSVVHCMR